MIEPWSGMLIGELARLTSVSPRLLRYYEQQGLLVSNRLSNGYRDYADDAPMIVGQIRALLDAGLPTEVIREVLPCAEGKPLRFEACPSLSALLSEVLGNIESRMDKLSHHREALTRYLEAAK
jgi:DNA-binding transcriptional MerR regulator